ncbi:hypothetical protein JANLI_58160 [Janthinobacterium lividum]|nr:hypothetical protein JANLI_58160 [Janthinobacterium lividum]
MSMPFTAAVPLAGCVVIATAVNGPPVAPCVTGRVTGVPANTVTVLATGTGTGCGATVTLTVAGADVPPGPVAV